MYTVPKGTRGNLLKPKYPLSSNVNPEFESKEWVTRKDCEFFETVHDPVSQANGRGMNVAMFEGLAAAGYGVFAHLIDVQEAPKYYLAVLYNEVKIA
jgi:hypothetical protein